MKIEAKNEILMLIRELSNSSVDAIFDDILGHRMGDDWDKIESVIGEHMCELVNRIGAREMTQKTKHTPTPWVSSETYVFDGYDCEVANTNSSLFSIDVDKANAAHIVKCVNMHDELVGTINKAVLAWENTKSGHTSVSEIQRWLIEDMKPAIDECREALKKAGAL